MEIATAPTINETDPISRAQATSLSSSFGSLPFVLLLLPVVLSWPLVVLPLVWTIMSCVPRSSLSRFRHLTSLLDRCMYSGFKFKLD